MAEWTADQWQSWVQKLPEQYRDNPDEFLTEFHEAEQAKTWVDKVYKPWQEENREGLTAYQRWQQEQRQLPNNTPPPARTPETTPLPTNIDWDDPDQAKMAFNSIAHKLQSVEERLANETATLRGEFAQGRENVVSLIGLLQQAQQIEREDLYGHLNYKPKRDVTEIARYAAEHQIPDLNRAAQDRYGEQTVQERIEAARREERERVEREFRNRDVVTERGGRGAPRGVVFRGERQEAKERRGGGLRTARRDYEGLYEAINKQHPDIEW